MKNEKWVLDKQKVFMKNIDYLQNELSLSEEYRKTELMTLLEVNQCLLIFVNDLLNDEPGLLER